MCVNSAAVHALHRRYSRLSGCTLSNNEPHSQAKVIVTITLGPLHTGHVCNTSRHYLVWFNNFKVKAKQIELRYTNPTYMVHGQCRVTITNVFPVSDPTQAVTDLLATKDGYRTHLQGPGDSKEEGARDSEPFTILSTN